MIDSKTLAAIAPKSLLLRMLLIRPLNVFLLAPSWLKSNLLWNFLRRLGSCVMILLGHFVAALCSSCVGSTLFFGDALISIFLVLGSKMQGSDIMALVIDDRVPFSDTVPAFFAVRVK